MSVVLKPLIDKKVKDETKNIIDAQVIPWAFFHTSQGVSVKYFSGKKIHYSGLKFSGTPIDVFWSGYIEPYLEDFIIHMIDAVYKEAKENSLNLKSELDYLSGQLNRFIAKIYTEMQRVDYNLRKSDLSYSAKQEINSRCVNGLISEMRYFSDQHIAMALNKKISSKGSYIVRFFNKYKKVCSTILIGLSIAAIVAIFGIDELELQNINSFLSSLLDKVFK